MENPVVRCGAESREQEMISRTCERIVDHLRAVMSHGLTVSEDVLFFAETTYGLEAADIAGALTDPDFEDREIIMKLVLYPDRSTRMAVEVIIGDGTFTPEDQRKIIETLLGEEKVVPLRVPGSHASFSVPLTRGLVTTLVEKLYLARVPDRQICAALNEHLPPPAAQSAKIMLRCRGDRFTGTSRRFLCSLIEKAAGSKHDFAELFSLSLTLLAELPPAIPAEAYFLDRKRVLNNTLKNIREFEQKKDHYGMEYLMMQRYQVPIDSEEAVLHKLELLSTITDELFNLLPASTQYIRQHDLGVVNPAQNKDMDKLFRRFS